MSLAQTTSLTDRLPTLDRRELLTLRANAVRLEAAAGAHADEAGALLPLIEAELERRGPAPTAKAKAKPRR